MGGAPGRRGRHFAAQLLLLPLLPSHPYILYPLATQHAPVTTNASRKQRASSRCNGGCGVEEAARVGSVVDALGESARDYHLTQPLPDSDDRPRAYK